MGQELDRGWHVRLEFVRRWSDIAALPGLPARAGTWDQDEPIVAVTLARMRIPELPRFLRHGRPVERLVRDHPGVDPRGRRTAPAPHHLDVLGVAQRASDGRDGARPLGRARTRRGTLTAMRERERRDFHHEFATYRFRPLVGARLLAGPHGHRPDLGELTEPESAVRTAHHSASKLMYQ